jgi:hypothetical protein
MRFTLIYDGVLPPQTAHDGRVNDKSAIRKVLHCQLQNLWANHPVLAGALEQWRKLQPVRKAYSIAAISDPPLIEPMERAGIQFIPLVTNHLATYCELDILFLRREPKGFLVNAGGDLDNRIKMLFDAFRVPQDASELPALNGSEPNPFFCLLEDDSLITSVKISSERLLEGTEWASPDRVRLVINVITRVHRLTYGNLGLCD